MSDVIGCRSQMRQGLVSPGAKFIHDNDGYDLSMVSGTEQTHSFKALSNLRERMVLRSPFYRWKNGGLEEERRDVTNSW